MVTYATQTSFRPAVASDATPDDDQIERALGLAHWLVTSVEAFATQLALPDLGTIELPPITGAVADQAHVRSAAALYIFAQLEAAQLLPAVETVSALFAASSLLVDAGAAADRLTAFWRSRHERFAVVERRAMFARLFGDISGSDGTSATTPAMGVEKRGGGRNQAFENLMVDLTEALRKREDPNFAITDARLRQAALQLSENLVERGGGMASYAARELLGTVQEAIAILKLLVEARLFGAQSVWAIVRVVSAGYLKRNPGAVHLHMTLGKTGEVVLTWLANVYPRLDTSAEVLVEAGHPAIAAATAWLQASLDLHSQVPG